MGGLKHLAVKNREPGADVMELLMVVQAGQSGLTAGTLQVQVTNANRPPKGDRSEGFMSMLVEFSQF